MWHKLKIRRKGENHRRRSVSKDQGPWREKGVRPQDTLGLCTTARLAAQHRTIPATPPNGTTEFTH